MCTLALSKKDLVFENAFANPGATKFIVVSEARTKGVDEDEDDEIDTDKDDNPIIDLCKNGLCGCWSADAFDDYRAE